jgi:hypothetical protein
MTTVYAVWAAEVNRSEAAPLIDLRRLGVFSSAAPAPLARRSERRSRRERQRSRAVGASTKAARPEPDQVGTRPVPCGGGSTKTDSSRTALSPSDLAWSAPPSCPDATAWLPFPDVDPYTDSVLHLTAICSTDSQVRPYRLLALAARTRAHPRPVERFASTPPCFD